MYAKIALVILLSALPKAFAAANCGPEAVAAENQLNIALTNLKSFDYVHAALAQVKRDNPQAEFCVSGLPLSKNTYQYFEYYIQIDAVLPNSAVPLYRFRFVFQNASVQALHNVGVKPWIALPPTATDELWASLVSQAKFTPAVSTGSVETIVESTGVFKSTKGTFDASSFAVAALGVRDGNEISVAGRLTKPSANVFASFALPKTVLVVRNLATGEAASYDGLWTTSSIQKPLYQILANSQPVPGADRTAYLLEISRDDVSCRNPN